MSDPFDSADYYDSPDAERLSHDTLHEYVDHAVDEACNRVGEPVEEIVARMGSLEVVAYKRHEPTYMDLRALARSVAIGTIESISQAWDDEGWTDPEDSDGANLPDDVEQKLTDAILDVMQRTAVWHCDEVARRTLTADEILEELA